MTGNPAPDGTDVEPKPTTLIRVLAQIRWPKMSAFAHDRVADELAAQIGKDYPLRERNEEMQIVLTPAGVTQQSGGTLHRYSDGDRHWSVTFAETFLTLETSAYISHEDFIPRLTDVAAKLRDHLPLPQWERFGYRYTNRIEAPNGLSDLDGLFKPPVLGTLALDFPDPIVHTISESIYQGQDASLLVKSAFLPAKASIDPTIPPIEAPSWLLDLDAFANGPSRAFSNDELATQALTLSKKAHSFFEGVTTSEFRNRFAV